MAVGKNEELLILGRIEGRLEEMRSNTLQLNESMRRVEESLHKRLNDHEHRIRKVELDAARSGALSGGVTAGLVSLIVEAARRLL